MSALDDEVLTIDDLAKYLKLKRQTIYRWAQKGNLPGAKIGKEWRFRRSVIEEWIVKTLGEPQLVRPRTNGTGGASSRSAGSPPRGKPSQRPKPAMRRRRSGGGPEKS